MGCMWIPWKLPSPFLRVTKTRGVLALVGLWGTEFFQSATNLNMMIPTNHPHTHSHHEEHFTQSVTLRDLIIGMSDGLTVPFALAAGLSGAVSNNSIILTAGLAEVVAGSIAMGLGGYLAGKTAVEHFQGELTREYMEVEKLPEKEKQEVRDVFAAYGLSKELQNQLVEEIAKDKHKWVDFMMRFELGLEKPNPKEASQSALRIGFAYAIGGMIPLSTYFFTQSPNEGLILSSGITLFALFVFGYWKSKFIGQNPLKGAIKVVFIGAIAALAAFLIARLFQS